LPRLSPVSTSLLLPFDLFSTFFSPPFLFLGILLFLASFELGSLDLGEKEE
jgi:hypothetical protein